MTDRLEVGQFAPLSGLEGTWLHRPPRFEDPRGDTGPVLVDADWRAFGWRGFIQENQSRTPNAGVIRGLHFQSGDHAQARIVRVVQGAAYSVALDPRPESPTFGRHAGAQLSARGGTLMFVPAGLAHGLQVLEPDTIVCWATDHPFTPIARGGVVWNDPSAAIAWPITASVSVSDADQALPRLTDLERGR
uniref:dTDP-4-dehydrorhamnose 3,5-epimerase n=1 Tax=Caulobacter sp. (strain K31) TaxID=366602 RepID=B0T597_CAUSK